MANVFKLREKHKMHLLSLLRIKSANQDKKVEELDKEIVTAIAPMEQEDIAWVEKLAGIKAID